jgi:prepilin-type processing-associated H-X9-DG protein
MIYRRSINQTSAFTMVELLVLTAILAVLAALVLPALDGAHEIASRAACANNLRQIGLGMLLYSNDYKGNYPTCKSAADGFSPGNCSTCFGTGVNGAVQFFRKLVRDTYVPSPAVFICPSDREAGDINLPLGSPLHKPVSVAATWETMQWYNKSYLYVSRLSSRRGPKPYLLMADETWGMHANCGGPAPPCTQVAPPVSSADNHGTAGRNALFSDGHVQWVNGEGCDVGPSSSDMRDIDRYLGPGSALQQDYTAYGLNLETID